MSVEISPATTTRPVVISVSQATRPSGSSVRTASRIASEIWSAILSGWPSVTDSDVNRNERADIGRVGYRTPGSAPGLLAARAAAHQRGGELAEALALQHPAHGLGDRQLDLEPARQVAQHRCGGQTLDHVPDLGDRLGRGGALRDQL